MKIGVLTLAALCAFAVAGCGGNPTAGKPALAATTPGCPTAWRSGWQKLADRIHAPVYCPSWMPQPLDAKIGGQWNNIDSVSRDHSYLIGFVWQEQNGEKHVNFRGYPGREQIPTCIGENNRSHVPCFEDPKGTTTVNGVKATFYTVNHGADQWHVLYAWHARCAGLYTVSQHVAAPLSYTQVRENVTHILRSLVVVAPRRTGSKLGRLRCVG